MSHSFHLYGVAQTKTSQQTISKLISRNTEVTQRKRSRKQLSWEVAFASFFISVESPPPGYGNDLGHEELNDENLEVETMVCSRKRAPFNRRLFKMPVDFRYFDKKKH